MGSDLRKNEDMKNSIESAYEEFGFIACGILNPERKNMIMKNVRLCLGGASDALDNMIYERMGLSAEEVFEIIDMDATMI